jgi:hypothetical protein
MLPQVHVATCMWNFQFTFIEIRFCCNFEQFFLIVLLHLTPQSLDLKSYRNCYCWHSGDIVQVTFSSVILILYFSISQNNRLHRLFTFRPVASFSCWASTRISCTIGFKNISLWLSLSWNTKKFVQKGEHNLYVRLSG